MSPSREPRSPTRHSNAPPIYPYWSSVTGVAQPFPGLVVPENHYDDLTMMDRPDPDEGSGDILDRLQIETRESEKTPSSVHPRNLITNKPDY